MHTPVLVGIDHVFVNWGSDHPVGRHARRFACTHSPSSPNEMSATQEYAQVTGDSAIAIVHVHIKDTGKCRDSIFVLQINRGVTVTWLYPWYTYRGLRKLFITLTVS